MIASYRCVGISAQLFLTHALTIDEARSSETRVLNFTLFTRRQRQRIPLNQAATRQSKRRYITESRSSKLFLMELTYTRTGEQTDISTPTAPHTKLRNMGTLALLVVLLML